MAEIIKPRNADETQQAIAWAVGEEKPLEIVSGASKRSIGRPLQCYATLDLTGLTGITLYEPEELVLSARAGTPLTDIRNTLAQRGQELAFEPVDLGPVLGGEAERATLGGVVATNIAGPRRIKAGAVRDHFLGVAAVSGRGEIFKSGGRVVKNVTGYDLCKLLAGSWGTLAAMTDITLKVLPAAETQTTLLAYGLDDAAAAQLMSAAMGSSCDVSAAAHLPKTVAEKAADATVAAARAAVTALRLEGFGPSVAYRTQALTELMTPFGETGKLDEAPSSSFWRDIGDVMPFARNTALPLWRISVAPLDGYKIVRRVLATCAAEYYFDWAGGLVWLQLPDDDDAKEARIRGALSGSGHATLMRAHANVRAAVDVFQPQAEALGALSRRLKSSFDPKGVLNPGRMTTGS